MPRRRPPSRLRSPALAAVLRLLSAVFSLLSWRGAQRLGRGIGALGWRLSRRDRRRALDHLAIAFPDLSERDRRRLGRDCFRHHGTTLAECLYLLRRDCATVRSVVEVEGWEEVERVRATDRPILILTGHCGNWELLAA